MVLVVLVGLCPNHATVFKRYAKSLRHRASHGVSDAEVILQVIKDGENGNAPLRVRTSEWAENFTRLKTQADPDGTKLVNEVIENFL